MGLGQELIMDGVRVGEDGAHSARWGGQKG